jgi:hypothetical protein
VRGSDIAIRRTSSTVAMTQLYERRARRADSPAASAMNPIEA